MSAVVVSSFFSVVICRGFFDAKKSFCERKITWCFTVMTKNVPRHTVEFYMICCSIKITYNFKLCTIVRVLYESLFRRRLCTRFLCRILQHFFEFRLLPKKTFSFRDVTSFFREACAFVAQLHLFRIPNCFGIRSNTESA